VPDQQRVIDHERVSGPEFQTGPRAARLGVFGISATVAAVHVIGWGAVLGLILPALVRSGANPGPLLALSLSAYALGIRHAFDADHIAAIDNAARQLVTRGRRSSSVGFWFALGHSTVVLLAVLFIAAGARSFTAGLTDDGSALRQVAGIWGGSISGVFLLAAGILNLPALASLRASRRRLRSGRPESHPDEITASLDRRGVLFRLLRPLTKLVDRPSRMYPVGFLFGLGLDTAASISLFALAGTFTVGLPWYSVMVLPVLFTAGMTLFDTADGVMVSRVYRWASSDSSRTLDYNIVMTSVSVALAFAIGVTGLLSVLAQIVGSGSVLSDMLGSLDMNILGIGAVIFFALVWMTTTLLRKAQTARTLRVARSQF
jgi:high-affinity nickel-transport protein